MAIIPCSECGKLIGENDVAYPIGGSRTHHGFLCAECNRRREEARERQRIKERNIKLIKIGLGIAAAVIVAIIVIVVLV